MVVVAAAAAPCPAEVWQEERLLHRRTDTANTHSRARDGTCEATHPSLPRRSFYLTICAAGALEPHAGLQRGVWLFAATQERAKR